MLMAMEPERFPFGFLWLSWHVAHHAIRMVKLQDR
jgi:hypothetical protein